MKIEVVYLDWTAQHYIVQGSWLGFIIWQWEPEAPKPNPINVIA